MLCARPKTRSSSSALQTQSIMDARTNWLLLINAALGNFLAGTSNRIFSVSLPTMAGGDPNASESRGVRAGDEFEFFHRWRDGAGGNVVFGAVGKRRVGPGVGFRIIAHSNLCHDPKRFNRSREITS